MKFFGFKKIFNVQKIWEIILILNLHVIPSKWQQKLSVALLDFPSYHKSLIVINSLNSMTVSLLWRYWNEKIRRNV